jgi:hypothetical protein
MSTEKKKYKPWEKRRMEEAVQAEHEKTAYGFLELPEHERSNFEWLCREEMRTWNQQVLFLMKKALRDFMLEKEKKT